MTISEGAIYICSNIRREKEWSRKMSVSNNGRELYKISDRHQNYISWISREQAQSISIKQTTQKIITKKLQPNRHIIFKSKTKENPERNQRKTTRL